MAKGLYKPLNPQKYNGDVTKIAEKHTCAICSQDYKSAMSVARHITQTHKISTQNYFDKFLKKENDGVCECCSKPTKFVSMTVGYQVMCGHACGATKFRNRLKTESDKYDQFVKRISSAQIKVWTNRSPEEKQKIMKNFTESSFNKSLHRNTSLRYHTEIKHELELIARRECYVLGLKPNMVNTWDQIQKNVYANLENLFDLNGKECEKLNG